MLYDIDFLPVGEGEKSGDAIALRYSIDNGQSWIVGVIDGGTQESGEELCNHIGKYYNTNVVDFVICTHPDQDHASGLAVVFDNMEIKQLLMHRPWNHVDKIFNQVSDGRVTRESLKKKLIEGHPHAYTLEEKALNNNIPIIEPFFSKTHHVPCMTILGPSIEFYLSQLVNFRSISEITEDSFACLMERITIAAQKYIKWIVETWDDEKLIDPLDDATSSENNSCVILHFNFGGNIALLRGACS